MFVSKVPSVSARLSVLAGPRRAARAVARAEPEDAKAKEPVTPAEPPAEKEEPAAPETVAVLETEPVEETVTEPSETSESEEVRSAVLRHQFLATRFATYRAPPTI